MNSIFTVSESQKVIQRIEQLTPTTTALWGKMSVAQMLAHCNVTYEMIYENIHPKPNILLKLLLKMFVKNAVVTEKPYKKSSQTAPAFLIKDDKNFEAEKKRLIDYITRTQQLGESHFDNKESHSFGRLTKNEWNNMLYKHLDHHLHQFGV